MLSRPEQVLAAASELRYPVLIKPNIGGSGAGIQSFATLDELAAAVEGGRLDFGIDHVGLLQEHVSAEGDAIVRIEILDGEFLYAIRRLLTPGTFNLCPMPAPTAGCLERRPELGNRMVSRSVTFAAVAVGLAGRQQQQAEQPGHAHEAAMANDQVLEGHDRRRAARGVPLRGGWRNSWWNAALLVAVLRTAPTLR